MGDRDGKTQILYIKCQKEIGQGKRKQNILFSAVDLSNERMRKVVTRGVFLGASYCAWVLGT